MNHPNPDCASSSELESMWIDSKTHPVKTARSWFPDKNAGYVSATKDIGHYAINKKTAIDCRLRGDINSALYYEEICDRIYSRIPLEFSW